ncbi:heat-induced catalase [Coprinopsis cinerea okayama7|uniref:Catalase n=1 Tax=Coprinopsis cinerea (strain Okayama-7 / 130 / ATCC MYA-4618 / FGSC 9003) TaxID=240176 RepID=A8NN17_COPC7|nr:heat-induced catalase [Coprinopsis cinerea okayama7\|eukprot:XP_001835035.2 heat-induced catalase [Coprinopsis cinerea okayama7\
MANQLAVIMASLARLRRTPPYTDRMPSAQVWNTKDGAVYTTSNGAPVNEPYAAQRAGINGPLLLQDFHHIDLLAHFDRERIPERVVHAKGAGAHGYFETTHSLSDITSIPLFQKPGTKVRATVRFSTVGGESGSADTARDPRGFAIKLRTEDGNWDWVFNNTPVFFLRDPAKFPHFIHTQKRDPQTHLKDSNMFWDYLSQNPESIHQVMILFSDRGTPDGYFHEHGYSGHTFKWLKDDGTFVYTQVHVRADSGFKTLDADTSVKLAGENPDYGTQTLFEAIENGNHPSWTVYVQTMTPEQAESFRYNILDLTKVWPHAEFPLRPVGKLVLNENPQNYFAEIEQSAFSPSHLIPYVEPSADPVLQSRLFSYPDTHRHRLGVNYQQLPVNAPIVPVANFQRDGPATFVSQVDFEQPRALWSKVWNDEQRAVFVKNVSGHLGTVKSDEIKARQLSVFARVDQSLSDRIAAAIGHSPVQPLAVKPAAEAVRFRANLGFANTFFQRL